MTQTATRETIESAYRRAWPSLLGQLLRACGSLERAEDALQEACLRALQAPPLNDPVAWIATTARRIVIDEQRREVVRRRHEPALLAEQDIPIPPPEIIPTTGDDRLDLLLLACHPVLPSGSRMPLALRFVLGAPTEAIADAFLIEHATLSARLTRARRRLDQHGRRFDPPGPHHRSDVLDVIAVLYTLGHTALIGPRLSLDSERAIALDLARAATRAWPEESEAGALLALLLLTEGREPGRIGPDGHPRTLRNADRSTWDQKRIGEGIALATQHLPTMGRYALQAGISGLHCIAPSWEATDWTSIVRLYDRLIERWPSLGAQISRAVARGYGVNPQAGLDELAKLEGPFVGAIARQHATAKADLLRLAGRTHEARAAYLEALALERNQVLRDYLDAKIIELAP